MRELQTSTLSNQNIASDLLVATYTADADRALMVDIVVDQVAGNGDYTAYIMKQKAGAGSWHKTAVFTLAAASGVTSIWFPSIILAVLNTDVIRVYIKGLAGDNTTPDITTSICELTYLRPTTAGRTLDVSAAGGAEIDATLVADAVWDELLAGHVVAGSAGVALSGSVPLTAAQITAAVVAVLTQLGVTVEGVDKTVVRGDTWSVAITDLGALPEGCDIWVTVKTSPEQVDTAAILKIQKTIGLEVFNGAAAGTPGNASIAITDAVDGDILVTVKPAETLNAPIGVFYYDVQVKLADGTITTPANASGRWFINPDVTREV